MGCSYLHKSPLRNFFFSFSFALTFLKIEMSDQLSIDACISHYLNPSSNSLRCIMNNFKVFYLNVNRLQGDLKRERFFLSLDSFGIEFDILVLVETFFDNEISAVKLRNYQGFHNIRDRMGGGVSIYVNERHVCKMILNSQSQENQFLIVNFPKLKFNIGGVYRPPHTRESGFFSLLDSTLSSFRNTILFGDFNLNILLSNESLIGRYCDVVSTNGFVFLNDVVDKMYTREGLGVCSLIDHVLTDIVSFKYGLALVDDPISDHRAILLDLNKRVRREEIRRMVRKCNYERVHSEILSLINKGGYGFAVFHEKLELIVQSNTTEKQLRVSSVSFRKPWFTREMKNLKKLRRKFYRLLVRYPHNEFYRSKFIHCKTVLGNLILSEKKSYYSNKFEENLTDPRRTWSTIYDILNLEKKKSNTVWSIFCDGHIIDDKLEICNAFNRHFCEISEQLAEQLPDPNPHYFSRSPTDLQFLDIFEHTNEQEVLEIINGLKNTTSVGSDGFSVKSLKLLKNELAHLLVDFINQSFDSGCFPDSLKMAKIIPLFKGGDSSKTDNYRPIAILPAISKVFESVIRVRLVGFLKRIGFVNSEQFAFWESTNAVAACVNLLRKIFDSLNKKNKTAILMIDIRKAFDCIDHGLLLRKLRAAGVRGKALDLLASYLEDRFQYVEIEGIRSESRRNRRGIPQGSILGPLLFLVFINDIFSLHLFSSLQLFADDATSVFSCLNYQELRIKMKHDLKVLYSWFVDNRLSINIVKTNFMIFNMKNTDTTFDFDRIEFLGSEVSRVYSARILGLNLNTTLTFTTHIDNLIIAIRPFVSMLSRLKYYLETDILKKIYFAFVHSRVIYMLPLYSSAPDYKISQLNVLHKKALKHILKLPFDFPTALLYRDNLRSLDSLIKSESCILYYKIAKGLLRYNFALEQRVDISSRNTRSAQNFIPMFSRLSCIKNSFFSRACTLFNGLSSEIKNAESLRSFKTLIRGRF